MHSIIYLAVMFIAKVIDNAINTTKTIMIQRSRWVLAGIAVILSDFIYFWIMRNVVTSDNMLTMLIVAVAGGVGCSIACFMNDKLSKDRTYVNVIMSDNLEAMKDLIVNQTWRKIHFTAVFDKSTSESNVVAILTEKTGRPTIYFGYENESHDIYAHQQMYIGYNKIEFTVDGKLRGRYSNDRPSNSINKSDGNCGVFLLEKVEN